MNNKVLITGGLGQLGLAFQQRLTLDNIDFCSSDKNDFDISDIDQVQEIINTVKPDIIINCAAYNLVDQAEKEPQRAFSVNREGAKNLALLCREKKIFLVHYGTDYIFDGKKNISYTEQDSPNPLNQYGQSKFDGEKAVQEILSDYLIFRVSWVFGEGQQNFLYKLNCWTEQKTDLKIANDETSCPTFTHDIVEGTMRALKKKLVGLYHMPNSGSCSRSDWAEEYFKVTEKTINVEGVSSDSFDLKALRPKFSSMENKKVCESLGWEIPTWQDAVKRFAQKEKKIK